MVCQVKDNNGIRGKSRITCPFYEEQDTTLGSSAASSPASLLDSGVAPSQSDGIHSPRSCSTAVEGDSEETAQVKEFSNAKFYKLILCFTVSVVPPASPQGPEDVEGFT